MIINGYPHSSHGSLRVQIDWRIMSIDCQTSAATLHAMQKKLSRVMPDFEIRQKAELVFEINQLKKKLGAIILGHNYMEPALYQTVPDVVGDSLALAKVASQTDKDPIVFCGVRFMAETAKILNPEKTVLLPTNRSGCSLAESITVEDVRWLRARFPGVPVVSYINTYASVKAESDICCTSSNTAAVIDSLESDTAILIPDEYLARNVANETGKEIIFPTRDPGKINDGHPELNYQLIGWSGRCMVHDRYTTKDIEMVRRQFPGVMVLAHPECSAEVVNASDYCGSTTGMINKVRDTQAPGYLLLTECTMGDNIIADCPDKEVIRLCSIRCPYMNEITLEQTLASLKFGRFEIELPASLIERARKPIEAMMRVS
jgi:quinolinate synthase